MTYRNHRSCAEFFAGRALSRGALLLALLGTGACARVDAGTEVPSSVGPEATPDAAARWARALRPTPSVGGVGWLETRGANGEAGTQLALASLDVRVLPAGLDAAHVEVEHRFHNDGDEVMEGTFRFTLPPDAVVTGLAMEIGGELMEGEFVEKHKARRTYEQIVDSMRDPALLEWEQGKTFKLRVFPIEPHADKRVVLRYLAPTGRDAQGRPELVYPLAAPAMRGEIGEVTVSVGDRRVIKKSRVHPDERVVVPLSAAFGGEVPVRVQDTAGGRFMAVRVAPDWSTVPRPAVPAAPRRRQVVLVIDSSRSALEAWPLVRESARRLMASLERDDELAVLAGDLTVRDLGDGWGPATSERIGRIDAALGALEPDGASDLGRAFTRAGALLEDARNGAGAEAASVRRQIVYLGDGSPTWGDVDDARLAEVIDASVTDAELHALGLGKSPRQDYLRRLTGDHGGAALDPLTADQVDAFADFVTHADAIPRVEHVRVEAPAHAEVIAPPGGTWFLGEQPTVLLRFEAEEARPGSLTVHGEVDGEPVQFEVPLDGEVVGEHIDQLWAAGRLEQLSQGIDAPEDRDARNELMVRLSREHGVMSRATSLLVLESEEAYARHQIERAQQAGPPGEDPSVSGRDLESLGGENSSLTPGDLQPGDPEIDVPAPADARSVAAVFPFGETKQARWDEVRGVWTLRFLVDADTAAGTYEVPIRITHADGRVELTSATYTVDMVAPTVRLTIEPTRTPGTFRVLAEQVLAEADAHRERPEGVRTGSERPASYDARRVRVLMPDGQTLILVRGRPGAFERDWTPRHGGMAGRAVSVELTVTDRALNTRRQRLDVTVGEAGNVR